MNTIIPLLLLIGFLAAQVDIRAAERGPLSAEWEATLNVAKADREVMVGCEPTPVSRNALMQFQQAYPEIKLTLNPIGARDYATGVLAERRTGKYLADVFSGGTTAPSQVLVPANALEPIRTAFLLPEVANEALS